jgi:hypothetical protein
MLYKSPRRRPTAEERRKRRLQEVGRALHEFGGWEQLRQQYEAWRKSPQPIRGPRPFIFDTEFLAVLGDWFARASHRQRVEFIGQVYQSDKKQSEDKTLRPNVRRAWDPRRNMGGGTVKSIVRRLEKAMRKPKRV